ncbi:MAG: hypothetical protein HYY24_15405 [Verrucomicrobia bacterium]|nr:hypothetical protein [Verrucomicrobiota bacterium]
MTKAPPRQVIVALARYFHRNGYVRRQNAGRLSREGYSRYKKGDEVRLTAQSAEELARIRRLLELAGFKPGQPFVKARQYGQPVYGREAVRRFLGLMEAQRIAEPDGPANESQAFGSE